MRRVKLIIISLILPLLLLASANGVLAAKTRLLFFYQDDCHWCAQMDGVLHDPEVSGLLAEHARVIRINVYGHSKVQALGKTGVALKKAFGVYGTPTIILLGDSGRVLLKIPGVLTRDDFLDVIRHYIPGIAKLAAYQER
jgi:thioredoxin-related protein